MGDFGDGRAMSQFGDGQSMSDFAEPSRMSDFADGPSMDDFGAGHRMDEFGQSPPSPPPAPTPMVLPPAPRSKLKLQLVVAAAAVATVAVVSAVILASAGDNGTPIATGGPVPTVPPTSSPDTTADVEDDADAGFGSDVGRRFTQGTRIYDVTYTVLSSSGDPSLEGKTVDAQLTVSCHEAENECWTELVETGPSFAEAFRHLVVVDVNDNGDIEGTSFYPDQTDDCGGTFSHSISALMEGDTIEGEGAEDEIASPCDAAPGSMTFEFSGTLRDQQDFVVGNPPPTVPPSEATPSETTSTTSFPAGAEPAGPEAGA